MEAIKILCILFVMSLPVVVTGFVSSYILTKPGHIFEKYYYYINKKLPEWLSKPLGSCYICFSGQLALYLYPFYIAPKIGFRYDFFEHTYFISQVILNVIILKYFYAKIDVETDIADEMKKEIKEPPELAN